MGEKESFVDRPQPPNRPMIPHGSARKWVVLFILIGASITGTVLLASSFQQVDYNEYALKQDLITREINSQVYEEGLYSIGFWCRFIKFPSIYRTIAFSDDSGDNYDVIAAQTSDGLDISIELSFQFRLNKTEILDLYSEFGEDYVQYYITVARGELRNVAADYKAVEFFYNRSLVSTAMGAVLQGKQSELHCEIGGFQLRETTFPRAFEEAIEDVVVAQQDIQTALYEQQAARVRAETEIIQAQAEYNITIIEAQAVAKTLNITLTAEGLALFDFSQVVGFNQTQLLTYLWIKAILEHDDSYLIVGIDTPVIINP